MSKRTKQDLTLYYVPNGEDYHIAELLRDTFSHVVPFGCRDVADYIQRRPLAHQNAGANKIMATEVAALRPDLVYLESGYNIDPALLEAIRKQLGIPVTMWFGDACVDENHIERILRYAQTVDWQVVVDREAQDRARERGIANVEFVPFFGYDHYFKPLGVKKRVDILFTGKSYIGNTIFPFSAERLHFIEAVNREFGKGLHVVGEGWEPLGLTNYSGERVPEWDVNVLNNKSKIVLAFDATQTQDFTSCRTYHALLSGAFVLTRSFPGIEKFFVNGEHLVWFDTEEEGLRLIRHYLDSDEERERIASAGMRHVIENGWVFSNVATYLVARGLGRENRRFEQVHAPYSEPLPQKG